MEKIKPLVYIIGIFAFLMIFMFGQKVYGNMTDRNIESNESTEEKVEDTKEKMNEAVTGSDTAIESSETDEEKVEIVDQKMNEVLSSDEYSNMSLSERKELASGILLQLEQDGYISEVLYSEDGSMYSFEYSDGTLGGWCIKDFSAQDGMLPMN